MKLTDKKLKQLQMSVVILIDTREKKNQHITEWLDSKGIKWEKKALSFGDYSFKIPKNTELGVKNDIYFDDDIAIERKANLEEISNNISNKRATFKNEFIRGKGKMKVVIETGDYKDILSGNYKTELSVPSFIATLHSWEDKFKIPFVFIDKEVVASYILFTFMYYARNRFKN